MRPEETVNPLTWSAWIRKHGVAGLFGIDVGPHPFDSLQWKPGDADRSAAWKLHTQLRTRIATQRLDLLAGDDATALDSIYKLFGATRHIVDEYERCTHFATLTIAVLNNHIRPFTAKWHRWQIDGRLDSADGRYEFRGELNDLQLHLRSFARLIALLAQDDSAVAIEGASDEKPPHVFDSSAPLPFGIRECSSVSKEVADAINRHERCEVLARRKFYDLQENEDAVGLALSGGGIRSSTFALGVVQVLARKGVLHQVDFLSTVSGGGYLGTFISSFLNAEDPRATLKPGDESLPFGVQDSAEAPPIRHLRNHSKYLAEGGMRTLATAVSLVLYGIFTAALLIAPLLLTIIVITHDLSEHGSLLSNALIWLALFTVGAATLFTLVQKLGPDRGVTRVWAGICIGGTVTTLLCALFYELSTLAALDPSKGVLLLAGALLFPLAVGVAGLWLGPSTKAGSRTLSLLVLATPLLFWAITVYANAELTAHQEWWPLWAIGAVLLSLVFSSFFIDLNFVSPHLYYRNRLAKAYMVRPTADGIKVQTKQLVSKMNTNARAPYHLVNAAVNIPSSKNVDLRGRRADFFLFSKAFCGSPIIGYEPTATWESQDSHLDLGTAMAISAAAASPNMGTSTSARYTALLALMNVRLGYWLKKPTTISPLVAWWYFLKELTGFMSEKSGYVNVSDGGHIENLGIYELLRRRCRFIVAVDGEADPQRTFGGLLTLARLASIDLGIHFEPNLADLRINDKGIGKSHFVLAKIAYPQGGTGLLLYLKASLTGNESEFIQRYQAEHPDFPHQSTAEQLFDETRFEAYRALGEHAAENLFRKVLVGGEWKNGTKVSEWFRNLASRLL